MWRAVYDDPHKMKAVFASLAKILKDNAMIEVSGRGITIKGIDESRVAYAHVFFPADVFNVYLGETEIRAGINPILLKKIIKNAGKREDIELRIINDTLEIVIYNPSMARKFEIKLFEVVEDLKIKEIENWAVIDFAPGGFLAEVIKGALSLRFEDLKIVAKAEGRLIFLSETETGDKFEQDINLNECEYVLSYKVIRDSEAEYNLDYLARIIDVAKVASEGRIEFSTKMPLILSFNISGIRFDYILAPRVL